jgi:hypothetical protein
MKGITRSFDSKTSMLNTLSTAHWWIANNHFILCYTDEFASIVAPLQAKSEWCRGERLNRRGRSKTWAQNYRIPSLLTELCKYTLVDSSLEDGLDAPCGIRDTVKDILAPIGGRQLTVCLTKWFRRKIFSPRIWKRMSNLCLNEGVTYE